MLKSIRNSLVLTSVLTIALGVLLMLFPGSALRWASILTGAATLAWGIARIASYWKGGGAYNQRFDLFLGVILALLGLFLILCPQFLASVIPFALGVYVLVDSVSAIRRALDMKALGYEKWWASLAFAVLLALFGALMVFNPFGAMSTLVKFIGFGFIFDGGNTLVNTIIANRLYQDR